ncbi:uncharacterized protein LOC144003692 isoform X2 [Festucalex cinctus]
MELLPRSSTVTHFSSLVPFRAFTSCKLMDVAEWHHQPLDEGWATSRLGPKAGQGNQSSRRSNQISATEVRAGPEEDASLPRSPPAALQFIKWNLALFDLKVFSTTLSVCSLRLKKKKCTQGPRAQDKQLHCS